MFFDPRRYDLAHVGRYKFNKKLSFKSRLSGHILADDVVDTQGNVIAQAGDKLDRETAQAIQDAAVPAVFLNVDLRNSDGTITTKRVKVLSNMAVDITKWVDISKEEARKLGVTEAVFFPVLSQILAENESLEEIKEAICKNIADLIPKHITVEDIIASINYNMPVSYTHLTLPTIYSV